MSRNNKNRKDITLMTLLANESPKESMKLLKQYGITAKDYNDLEFKLADLYFKSNDKPKIEKELAEIHPHKKWLLRNLTPEKEEIKVEKIEPISKEKVEEQLHKEITSNASGCPCSSSFNDSNSTENITKVKNEMQHFIILGMIVLTGIIGITLVTINHQIKQGR